MSAGPTVAASGSIATRTACVVRGATPDDVRAVGTNDRISMRPNALGTLVTGRPGDLVIDYAAELSGPVYDVMYNPHTGWFSVTIFYPGLTQPRRWDNRPGTNPGYPRVDDILGATTPLAILAALDIPPSAIGYAEA
jgi:hypothetical protein